MDTDHVNIITQKAEKILRIEQSEEKAFEQLFRLLTESFGNKHYFCKIQGKRWAFLAGNDDMKTPAQQLQLTKHYGILYNRPEDSEAWKQVLEALQVILRQG